MALEEERTFLLRSIEDLDAELAAGDITEPDYRLLRDRYTARAAAVLRALDDDVVSGEVAVPDVSASDAGDTSRATSRAVGPPVHKRRRRLLVWGALALFAVVAVVLVVADVTSRLPGQTSSGSLELSTPEQLARALAQAQTLESQGKDSQALAVYHQVLARDPDQDQALAETGWLEFEAGVLATKGSLLSTGQAEEQRAERVAPTAFAPHLYLGSMALVEGEPSQAAREFSQFLADSPPVSEEQTAWPYIVRAFTDAGRTVPPVPAGVHG